MNKDAKAYVKRLEDIIVEYNRNRTKLDDDLISEMRASLSTGTYLFVENVILPAMEEAVLTELESNRSEVKAFNRIYEGLIDSGHSKSQAESLARKRYLGEEDYLKALEDNLTAKNIVRVYDMILKQANQVLNSMAKRINYV